LNTTSNENCARSPATASLILAWWCVASHFVENFPA
ncbi:hypothetical protein T01_5383, partial [Trichinella spiralis]